MNALYLCEDKLLTNENHFSVTEICVEVDIKVYSSKSSEERETFRSGLHKQSESGGR